MSDARYNFSSSGPSAQLQSDIQGLSAWSPDQLRSFSAVLLAYLGHSSNQEALLAEFLNANPALKSKVKPTLTSLLHFFSSSMKNSQTAAGQGKALVQQDLTQMGLSAEHAELLSTEFLSSLSVLSENAIAKTLQWNQLHDISWKFGVSASSSELDKMGSCFLQLQMVVEREGGRKENVLMELSLPQFYQFLQQMQLANRHMQNLSK